MDLYAYIEGLTFVDYVNFGIFIVFVICYFYQLYYLYISMARKCPRPQAEKLHRFAVVVPARNERIVIADIIRSVKKQNYPQELLDIFIIADNCTDDTAQISRDAGAYVYERFDTSKIGKGYVLNFGFNHIMEDFGENYYEAFFIFDADNILSPDYIMHMNDTFDSGAKAGTSYRNSKNFSTNWITAGYGFRFIREARFLSQARYTLGTTCAVGGTGFFISADVVREHGGYPWSLLTEDIEFSASCAVEGIQIEYNPDAEFFDEQPETFRDSWRQRFRWSKGFYQVFWHYGWDLFFGIFKKNSQTRFFCYDLLMTVAPGMLLTAAIALFNLIVALFSVSGAIDIEFVQKSAITCLVMCLVNYVIFMFIFGLFTVFVERKHMHCSRERLILFTFTFPIYMFTDIPIAIAALFKKAEWKPIQHKVSMNAEDVAKQMR